MKKLIFNYSTIFVALLVTLMFNFQSKFNDKVINKKTADKNTVVTSSVNNLSHYSGLVSVNTDVSISSSFATNNVSKPTSNEASKNTTLQSPSKDIAASNSRNLRLSRGGAPKQSSAAKNSDKSQSTYSPKKVELLDWWKEARNVFSVDSVAEVTDIYSGKTFKVKRTMGTNHADSEALTIEDTKIIKSIWGGFSWERRPVILTIDGRKLAASMSAMPHAGIDSAPAFKVINNRSDGYGRGENLDVIKHNGMDGHFDIHFLNSTRHKDGKKDPQHQEAVKIAAEK